MIVDFGVSELERLLCSPEAIGSIERLIPRIADAWTVRFPDLRSLPSPEGTFRPLRVCIATEDIVGPVRNGGIGTTYAALAEMLASLGHDTTILYLKGQEVESESIDHWVNFYAEKGVRFVPAPNYAIQDQFRTSSDRWLRAPYNMLRYLLDNPMDVVHVSEWRGSAYLSLLAKRQGLAFGNTLMVVKTSSPWMWNRLYGSQPLERIEDLAKVHAERQSVELADVVIGGSLHLLRWMSSQGYDIPRHRTFVQPNVASFETLQPLMHKRSLEPGSRIPIEEIVFFGRLEARKGLFIFCQAIKRLIRLGVPLPPKITFMGKPGAKLTARPDQSIPEYIESETRNWPTEVQVLSDFQQYEAIEYLLGGARLAVMPSVIENSSMAIYEAAICQVPCIATAVGGNAELIDEADWSKILCQPHPLSLGDKLREAIELGGYIPRPSFDNGANLETWRWFHRALGSGLLEHLLEERAKPPTVGAHLVAPSVCIYYTGRDEDLLSTVESLKAQELAPGEMLVAVDADETEAVDRVDRLLAPLGLPFRVVPAFDLDAGAAFNLLAEEAKGEFLLFLWEGWTLTSKGLDALSKVARSSGADVLNYFYRVKGADQKGEETSVLRATVIGSTTDAFFRDDTTGLPLFVRRSAFQELGGFTSDYRILCQDYEFVSKAQLAGQRCETALLELGAVTAWNVEWLRAKGYDTSISHFRAIRPQLAAAPLGMRDLLLASKGLQVRGGAKGWKRPKELDVVKQGDSLFGRMMDAMLTEPPKGGKPQPATAKLGPPSVPGQTRRNKSSGLLKLVESVDDVEQDPEPKPRARAAARSIGVSAAASTLMARVDTRREGNLIGQFVAVHDEHAYGWACDLGAPDRVLQIELDLDGRRSIHAADRAFPLSNVLPRALARHGFAAPLPSNWSSKLRRGMERRLSLAVADSGLTLTDPIVLPQAGVTLDACDVEGYCDPSDNGVIYGWAWRPGAVNKHVDIAVFIDGQFFTRLHADRYRDDLRHRGVGDGEHGFDCALPKAVIAEGAHVVHVVLADAGVPLARSPMHSEGATVFMPSRRPKLRWKI